MGLHDSPDLRRTLGSSLFLRTTQVQQRITLALVSPLFKTGQQNLCPQQLPAPPPPEGCQMDGGEIQSLGGKVGVNNSTLDLYYYCHYSSSVQ